MTEGPAGEPGSEEPAVHVVVQADSSEARAEVEEWLARQGFEPRVQWTAPTSLSYRLNTTDTNAVDEALRAREDLSWIVVAPGQPDYLLRELFVQGPDGRSFRFSDVPSATTVADLADELISQYPHGADSRVPGTAWPTVLDRVEPDGSSRRMDPDATLAVEGVAERDRLRVGYQAMAG